MTRKELIELIKAKRSFLCVGLDTDLKKIPEHLLSEDDPVFAFNKAIIDATIDIAVAYKPNLAFYESMGISGLVSLKKTLDYLREHYGIRIDENRYIVFYEVFAENLMPEITVLLKES